MKNIQQALVATLVIASIFLAGFGLYFVVNWPENSSPQSSTVASTFMTLTSPMQSASLTTSSNLAAATSATRANCSALASGNTSGPVNISGTLQVVVGSPIACQFKDAYKGTVVGLTAYEVIPLKVYSQVATSVTFNALNSPPGTWIHLSIPTVAATAAGTGENLTIVGAVVALSPEKDNYSLVLNAASSIDRLNFSMPLVVNGAPLILHSSSDQLIPAAISVPSNDATPWPTVVVYDPQSLANDSSILNVNLRVLGLSVNGSVQNLPSWLNFGFSSASLTLTPNQPVILSIHESNRLNMTAVHLSPGKGQLYTVAVQVTVNGVTSIQFVTVTIYPPVTL